MDGNVLPSKLLSHLSKAAGLVRSHDFIQIYSHYDADGLSSAGILANTLKRAGKEFRITTFTTLDEDNMQIIRECKSDCILISDLGASYIKQLEELGKDVIVLDHHTVHDNSEIICYVNPHLFGVDGMVGGCGATMSFLFSVQMDANNWDLVQLAFAGMAGDKQHLNGLTGFNAYLLEEGVKRGFITASNGSLIPSGPLASSLYLSIDPYISGVTGNQENVAKMLSEARISMDKTFFELTDDEKRRLSSMISVKLAKQGVTIHSMEELCRTRYYLKDWNMDAESLAELLDACGRLHVQGIGISMCLGSKNDFVEAMKLKTNYAKSVLEAIVGLEKRGLTEMEHIQYFESTSTGFTGILCGIAMRYFGNPKKPTIGINSSEEKVNISSRGLFSQLDVGVNLAEAMNVAASSVGGEGGGHKIASGASIKRGNEETFLKNLDAIIGKQINSAK